MPELVSVTHEDPSAWRSLTVVGVGLVVSSILAPEAIAIVGSAWVGYAVAGAIGGVASKVFDKWVIGNRAPKRIELAVAAGCGALGSLQGFIHGMALEEGMLKTVMEKSADGSHGWFCEELAGALTK
jgi:hypothetical protein